ncbi:ARM repeat-containing protein [Coniochaeta ligniaria NRRL 30616]|uniref:Nucleolar protein 9 n=1 Tax=Coniochaeta ligniaria NRRL 30616 TaxID=1408157 RepID=A0A1J7IFR4_9PEZI|nr:ARM repeat-containing protein [Coniochaeta ligniaria NRRL 30616]
MGKERKSKRQLIRDEKRKKQRNTELAEEETKRDSKRQRVEASNTVDGDAEFIPFDDDGPRGPSAPEKEFFGMLADEEQEYFRHADELLELNDFPSSEDRDIFLQNVYKEAEGKELKLASSQSCSRLMERLIMLSNTLQKKQIFEAFAGHFISLVTHRFASHCVEKLFMQSAPVVTEELLNGVQDEVQVEAAEAGDDAEKKPVLSMEQLFLMTLDEFEEHLSFLLSDKYASHALRVILVILSGRPLDQLSTKSLLQSKNKEHITVPGAFAAIDELASQTRTVPETFSLAIKKIIADSTATLDDTALRVLTKHPTGNPTLQLLLELDIQLNTKAKGAKADAEKPEITLIDRLVPGAPATFSDASSPASGFVNSMLYDPIGSRLLETLITHCPGRIFKGLQANFFGPRIPSLLRNDIASYPAMKVLGRLNKEDLVEAVQKSLEHIPQFIQNGRFSVIKTMIERCNVREATDMNDEIAKAVVAAYGGDVKALVPKLCDLDNELDEQKKGFQQDAKNKSALVSHGCQLAVAMLSIPKSGRTFIQTSLADLSEDQLLKLATTSNATVSVIIAALSTPSEKPAFHKVLVARLTPHTMKLATAQYGYTILNAIAAAPTKGEGISVPFFAKQNMVGELANKERVLRDSWTGRNVWRSWKGDLWNHRRAEWIRWAKEVDPEETRGSKMPQPKHGGTWQRQSKANNVPLAQNKRKFDSAVDA